MAEPSEQIVDEILVMDCQSGRAAALDLLVSRWQKRLWRYACRLTRDAEGAWEVTQESWLGIVRGIRRLNDPARFRPWAYQIVTNKANDWIRRKIKRSTSGPEDPLERQLRDGQQASETSADLEAILSRLPERSRTVLTLYYLEELDVIETAHVLNIPAGTVKSRLHTARTEFKKLWQAMEESAQTDMSAAQKGESE
ncbi:MAG: sigma-70 family RNA polymerase sigma factor [Phycisphaerales bacterium]|nr:MAG: sigma-70 family RNA polymerase sigma factor [Phycisphaerales bacterium]